MDGISGATLAVQIDARVAKLAQNLEKQQGDAALQLIESATMSPPMPDGRGSLLHIVA